MYDLFNCQTGLEEVYGFKKRSWVRETPRVYDVILPVASIAGIGLYWYRYQRWEAINGCHCNDVILTQ